MSRLWPAWVLISDNHMPHGTGSLAQAKAQSTKAVRMTTHQIRSDVKVQTRGQFVRVQLEGKNNLQLAQVEVYTTAFRDVAELSPLDSSGGVSKTATVRIVVCFCLRSFVPFFFPSPP